MPQNSLFTTCSLNIATVQTLQCTQLLIYTYRISRCRIYACTYVRIMIHIKIHINLHCYIQYYVHIVTYHTLRGLRLLHQWLPWYYRWLFRTVLHTYIHVVSGEVSTTPPEVGRSEGLDRNTQRQHQRTSTTHCSHSRLCCLHICAAHAVIQTAYVRGSIGSKLIVLLLYVTIVCYVTTDDVCLNVARVILLLLPSLTR